MLVDGTTGSMSGNEADQASCPRAETQVVGLGFPMAWLVALISPATVAVTDLATGPDQGKQTGGSELLRIPWDRLRIGDVAVGDRASCSYLGIAFLARRAVSPDRCGLRMTL